VESLRNSLSGYATNTSPALVSGHLPNPVQSRPPTQAREGWTTPMQRVLFPDNEVEGGRIGSSLSPTSASRCFILRLKSTTRQPNRLSFVDARNYFLASGIVPLRLQHMKAYSRTSRVLTLPPNLTFLPVYRVPPFSIKPAPGCPTRRVSKRDIGENCQRRIG